MTAPGVLSPRAGQKKVRGHAGPGPNLEGCASAGTAGHLSGDEHPGDEHPSSRERLAWQVRRRPHLGISAGRAVRRASASTRGSGAQRARWFGPPQAPAENPFLRCIPRRQRSFRLGWPSPADLPLLNLSENSTCRIENEMPLRETAYRRCVLMKRGRWTAPGGPPQRDARSALTASVCRANKPPDSDAKRRPDLLQTRRT